MTLRLLHDCDLESGCPEVKRLQAELDAMRRRFAKQMFRTPDFGRYLACPRFRRYPRKAEPACLCGRDTRKCDRAREKASSTHDLSKVLYVGDCWLQWIDNGGDMAIDDGGWLDRALKEAGVQL